MKYADTKIQIAISDAHMIACEGLIGEYAGPRRTALDLGAHVGTRSLWLMTDGGFDKVWAVECATVNFRLLRQNIKNNGFTDKIIPMLAAVDIEERICKVQFAGLNKGQCSIAYRDRTYSYFMATTPIHLLVQLIDEPIDFVKCDIEGTEYALFADPRDMTWLEDINCLFVETHAPNSDFFDPVWLEGLGYDPEDPNSMLMDNIKEFGFKIHVTDIGQIMAWK